MTDTTEYVSVPREPTDEMYLAAQQVTRDSGYGHCHDAVGPAVYRAILAAAPPPPADEDDVRESVKNIVADCASVGVGFWRTCTGCYRV